MPNSFAPVVVHIPHASQVMPPDVHASFVVPQQTLVRELLRMTDHFTDELFRLPSEVATSVVFPVSRLVVDPERFVDDAQEPLSARGMGVVYTQTSDGLRLRLDPFPASQRKALLDTYYFPHHSALSGAVGAAIEQHGKCLLIDGHSFAASPYPHEYDQSPNRPDICIGTDAFHTPSWLSDLALAIFRKNGFEVAVNRPFAGTIVPEPFYRRNPEVLSVMIEIKRSLYMDEATGQQRPNFSEFRAATHAALMEMIARASA